MSISFSNKFVRRQDRLLSEEQAIKLLRLGEHGVLSMIDKEGQAYGMMIPLSRNSLIFSLIQNRIFLR